MIYFKMHKYNVTNLNVFKWMYKWYSRLHGYICLTCLPGKYGSRCLYNCTGNCLNDETCNITTGECHSGCKTGYKGGICNKGILNCLNWTN